MAMSDYAFPALNVPSLFEKCMILLMKPLMPDGAHSSLATNMTLLAIHEMRCN